MTITVKELIEDRISYFKTVYEGKLDLIENEILILENILQAHENEISYAILNEQMTSDVLSAEIDEKDKEIKKLKNDFIPLYEWVESQTDYLEKLKEQQLFKEDFNVADFCINCRTELFYIDNIKKRKVNKNEKCSTCGWDKIIKLKDNSKYDTLPSKDVK